MFKCQVEVTTPSEKIQYSGIFKSTTDAVFFALDTFGVCKVKVIAL